MPTRAILRLPPGQIVSATSASNAATATILPTARPGPLLRRSHKVAARPRICAFRDVTIAMELGVDGVLLNTGIAHAKDPRRMALAMKAACLAGRLAWLSGRIPKRLYATASSPEAGTITAQPAR